MTYLANLTAMTLAALMFAPGLSADAQPAGCSPGLAKKNPPCVPPGQAKKGVTTEQWLTRHQVGERVDPDNVDWIDEFARYDLPPLSDGRRYATIDGTLVVLDPESYEILQLIRSAAAVFD